MFLIKRFWKKKSEDHTNDDFWTIGDPSENVIPATVTINSDNDELELEDTRNRSNAIGNSKEKDLDKISDKKHEGPREKVFSNLTVDSEIVIVNKEMIREALKNDSKEPKEIMDQVLKDLEKEMRKRNKEESLVERVKNRFFSFHNKNKPIVYAVGLLLFYFASKKIYSYF